MVGCVRSVRDGRIMNTRGRVIVPILGAITFQVLHSKAVSS